MIEEQAAKISATHLRLAISCYRAQRCGNVEKGRRYVMTMTLVAPTVADYEASADLATLLVRTAKDDSAGLAGGARSASPANAPTAPAPASTAASPSGFQASRSPRSAISVTG